MQRAGCSTRHGQIARPASSATCLNRVSSQRAAAAAPRAQATPRGSLTPQQKEASSTDVSATVVDTAFRVTPLPDDPAETSRTSLRVLFISESGICRAPLAAAALTAALEKRGLRAAVECTSAASQDYCVGDSPEGSTVAAAEKLGLSFPKGNTARMFEPGADLVRHDVILVMDKFTAADVLREASVFDTIYLDAKYSSKVRKIGEFGDFAAAGLQNDGNTGGNSDASDVEDPLYGNAGGEEEAAAVLKVAQQIAQCCEGMADWISGLAAAKGADGEAVALRAAMAAWLQSAGAVDWLAPPLLRPRDGY